MMLVVAVIVGCTVGTAIQPIVKHYGHHIERWMWARRYPRGECWCQECGKSWVGKDERARRAGQ